MNVLTVCGFGLCAAMIAFLLKQTDSRFSPAVTALSGAVMLGYIIVNVMPAFHFMRTIANENGAGTYFAVAVRSLGVSLVCQLSSEICRDLGENAVSGRIELAGKAAIILMSLPLVEKLLEEAKELL